MGTLCESLCNKPDPITNLNGSDKNNATNNNNKEIDKAANTNQNVNGYSNSNNNNIDESPIKIKNKPDKLTSQDFNVCGVLGKGTFGKVLKAEFKDEKNKHKKDKDKFYAMKIVKKSVLKEISSKENAMTEKNILKEAHFPFIVKLQYSFQDTEALYYIIEYVPGGELFKLLQKRGKFHESVAAFYAAEVFMCLKYLHKDLNTIYRDQKPENIQLDEDGHIKLTDFGLSKKGVMRASSFCGTPQYLAPEVLKRQNYNKMVDFWTLGCLIYEMLHGTPPFDIVMRKESDQQILYGMIMKGHYKLGNHISKDAASIIKGFLAVEPDKRLGHDGHYEIEHHPFFKEINWQDLFKKKVVPPIRPEIRQGKTNHKYIYEPTPEINIRMDVSDFSYEPLAMLNKRNFEGGFQESLQNNFKGQ